MRLQLIERPINLGSSIYMTKLMRHLRRCKRVAGDVICRPGRNKRIHHRKINGIGIALIELVAEDDRGSDQVSALVPFVFAGGGAFCVIASNGNCQFQNGIRGIAMPLLTSGLGGKKFVFPGVIPVEVFSGNLFSETPSAVIGTF